MPSADEVSPSQQKHLTMDNLRFPGLDSNGSESVENIVDQMLHQRLNKIFHERYLCSSSQIKEFIRAPEHSERNYIIDLIREQKGDLGRHFSRKTLEKLSLLWIAVLGCYYKSAELLVRSGANVNELYALQTGYRELYLNRKSTLLHALVQMDPSPENEGLVRLVVDHGADLQAWDSRGQAALHLAATEGLVQMAKVLLETGADLQARTHSGLTALHYAVEFDRIQLTEMLLEKGADTNAADNRGTTPLLQAVSSSINADVLVPLLIKHGADVSIRDVDGENVLSGAYVKNTDLAKFLIEKGASVHNRDRSQYQLIHDVASRGHIELLKLYLDHGANVNSLSQKEESPLHLAAAAGQVSALKILLERGANVDQRTTEGRTALHSACDRLYANTEIIRLLLSAGADMFDEDHNGETPFALFSANNENMERLTSSNLIVKKLALKKIRQPSIELKDERIVEQHPKLWDYYRDCVEQIEKAKSTRFVKSCTFFDLLKKCHCQIAGLMRNPEFETEFKRYDLKRSGFSTYAEDIVRAFERARARLDSQLEQEDVINEAFYGTLPYVVVRKVAPHTFACCENVK